MARKVHDSLMRSVFSDPRRAGQMLELFVGDFLSDVVDFRQLRPVPGRFVDEHLSQHETDLLFVSERKSREALVYILLEHQSTPVKAMAIRLMRYVSRIYAAVGAEHMEAGRVPPVFPVVLYQGHRRWNHPLSLGELVNRKSLPRDGRVPHESHFTLIRLQDVADPMLREPALPVHPAVSLALLSMKHARGPGFSRMLASCGDILSALYGDGAGQKLLSVFLSYFLAVANIPREQLAHLIVPATSPKVASMIKTTAEQLIEEGMARGLEKGRRRGQAEMLLLLLEQRFGHLGDDVKKRVFAAELPQLGQWIARVLKVDELHEVFLDK